MSTAPRPWSRPPRISGANGSLVQPSPGGTTSRWPAKPKCGRAAAARREQILDRPVRRLAGDEAVDREAERRQRLLEHVEHRAGRAGVTLGQAISRLARSTGSIAARHAPPPSIAATEEAPCPSSTSTRSKQTNRTGYPLPYRRARWRGATTAGSRRPAASTDFGVSHVVLEPGGISSQRHWHEGEDEFVVMLEGEAVLVEDEGETVLRAGDCAAFPKGVAERPSPGQPQRPADCIFVAIGSRIGEGDCHYPDIDLHLRTTARRAATRHKDGTPYA